MKTTKAADKYSVLYDYFSTQLGWHRARIKFLVLLITALCKMQSVGFEQLAAAMDSPAQISSSVRRIQRFFAAFTIDKDPIARLLFSLLPCKSNLMISIDRTNWQFGKTDINIFMLSVCYDGIAFPLLWKLLAKKGNTNTKERTDLLENFIMAFIGVASELTNMIQVSTMLRRLMSRSMSKRSTKKPRGFISRTTGLNHGNFRLRCAAGSVISERFRTFG